VVPGSITPTEAEVRFVEASDGGGPVEQYEIRYREAPMTNDNFSSATSPATVKPSMPGQPVSFRITGLKELKQYTVGVRARGCCLGAGPIAFTTFSTPKMMFKQLSGCFIATAAYGSPMETGVNALRRFRDSVLERSSLGSMFVRLYERSSPPVAAALRENDASRAIVRAALGPIVEVIESAQIVRSSH
jgi:hypothetical protein